MRDNPDGLIYVASLEELKAKGRMVARGGSCPVLVVFHDGAVYALDNRCPHLGFPLDRGSVEDGILTCHWHHARFDLTSGSTFDLWADDVPTCEAVVRDGEVWVARDCGFADPADHWRRRLAEGMEHNIGLVIGKAILGARAAGVIDRELVRGAALFGARNRDGWGVGLTILTALANMLSDLPEDEAYLALFQGIRRVAADCDGATPRRDRQPLAGERIPPETLRRWLRQWTAVRQRNAAERTLLCAVANGAAPPRLSDLMLDAATDRIYADEGHALDFINKSFECLDFIGWEHAPAVLPTTVADLVSARGGEETDAWRQPVDLVALLEAAQDELPGLFAAGGVNATAFTGHAELAGALLEDDPGTIIEALKQAIRDGAGPTGLSRSLYYAAALRIARFGTANEFPDWETAHHVFTYCNAVHQMLRRASEHGGDDVKRQAARAAGVFHGAMALYLTRYLNLPPARLPGENGGDPDGLPDDAAALCDAVLSAFNSQQQVNEGARLVAHYLSCGHPPGRLVATLARALLREDAGFHSYQILEAAVRQAAEWGEGGPEARNILVAATRYLAAHAPTERARYQTARTAQKLHRGELLHEGEIEVVKDC